MRTKMLGEGLHICVSVLIGLVLGAGTFVSGQESNNAKVARLLNESGSAFTKVDDGVWGVEFDGKSKKEIRVAISLVDGLLVTFSLIPESKGVKFPPPALQKLLNLNESLDRVKIGIDKEGLVFVRIDITVRTLDKLELTEAINQVAAATDEVHGHIRTHLPKAK